MLGLPASTEIKKLITKKKVYEHFGADMSADRPKGVDPALLPDRCVLS